MMKHALLVGSVLVLAAALFLLWSMGVFETSARHPSYYGFVYMYPKLCCVELTTDGHYSVLFYSRLEVPVEIISASATIEGGQGACQLTTDKQEIHAATDFWLKGACRENLPATAETGGFYRMTTRIKYRKNGEQATLQDKGDIYYLYQ
ncbi:hypothetical protein ACFLRF_00050 [Candidatus Altiarchaeota archaeon]